jgi:hypothetical protein
VIRWLLLWMLLLALLPVSGAAIAHTRSESYSSWTVSGNRITGVYQVDALRATQLADTDRDSDLAALVTRRLGERTRAEQAGKPCIAGKPHTLGALSGQLRAEIAFTCPADVGQVSAAITIAMFDGVSASHVHYARVVSPGGAVSETVLANGRSRLSVGGPVAAPPTDIWAFARLGLLHVLSGPDHIAFLLALTLLAGRPWLAVGAATGFTLGHSLTLGLVATGALKPDYPAIEALIGFTVVYAASEALAARIGANARAALVGAAAVLTIPLLALAVGQTAPPWPVYAGIALFVACAPGAGLAGSRRMAPLLAVAFGLVHGAGFAGPLVDMALPRNRLLPAVLGFNLGVEATQLLVLAALGLAALVLRRVPEARRAQAFGATIALLAGVGTFWFVSRSLI